MMHFSIEAQGFSHNFMALPSEIPMGVYKTNTDPPYYLQSKGQISSNNNLQINFFLSKLLPKSLSLLPYHLPLKNLEKVILYCKDEDYSILLDYREKIEEVVQNQIEVLYKGAQFVIYYRKESFVMLRYTGELGKIANNSLLEIHTESEFTKKDDKNNQQNTQKNINSQQKIQRGVQFRGWEGLEQQKSIWIGVRNGTVEDLIQWVEQGWEQQGERIINGGQIINSNMQVFLIEQHEDKYRLVNTLTISKGKVFETELKNVRIVGQRILQEAKAKVVDVKAKQQKKQIKDYIFQTFYQKYAEQINNYINESKENLIFISGEKNMLKTQFIKYLFKNNQTVNFKYLDLAQTEKAPKFSELKDKIKLTLNQQQNSEKTTILCIDKSDVLLNQQEENNNFQVNLMSKQLKKFFKKYDHTKFIIILEKISNLSKILLNYPHIHVLLEKQKNLSFWETLKLPQKKLVTGEYYKLYQLYLNSEPLPIQDTPILELTYTQIGGLHSQKEIILETFLIPQKYNFIFDSLPIKLSQGVLLYGPPGCGKTYLAQATAQQLDMNFLTIKGPELLNKYIGASEQGVRDLFDKAQGLAPCILFFDEFDALVPKRAEGSTNVTDRLVNQFLCYLDGVVPMKQVYILAASSRPELIDPALLRPGRIDKHVYLGLPDYEERKQIVEIMLKDNCNFNVEIEKIAQMTDHFVSADIVQLLKEVNIQKAQYLVENKNLLEDGMIIEKQEIDEQLLTINQEDIELSVRNFKPTLSLQDIDFYEKEVRFFKDKKIDISKQKSTLY